MKTPNLNTKFLAVLLGAGLISSALAQGMPPDAMDNIHKLFENHAAVKRTVTLTENGYVATTETDDPQLAKILRAHVSQMQERVEAGLGVRRWDPAYEEMGRHYSDLTLKVEPTEKGLRVVMTGKTPEAIKVAQNHAQIVSKFAEKGWPEHDVKHPAVASKVASAPKSSDSGCCKSPAGTCCSKCGNGEPTKSPQP